MASLRDLAARLNALADSADDLAWEAIARYTLEIVRALIQNTPVDTSTALSNWRVGSGAGGPIPALYYGAQGSTAGVSAAGALDNAESMIAALKGANKLVIFNAVPYIRALNDGSSRQAPAGFIEAAILQGRLAAKART